MLQYSHVLVQLLPSYARLVHSPSGPQSDNIAKFLMPISAVAGDTLVGCDLLMRLLI